MENLQPYLCWSIDSDDNGFWKKNKGFYPWLPNHLLSAGNQDILSISLACWIINVFFVPSLLAFANVMYDFDKVTNRIAN